AEQIQGFIRAQVMGAQNVPPSFSIRGRVIRAGMAFVRAKWREFGPRHKMHAYAIAPGQESGATRFFSGALYCDFHDAPICAANSFISFKNFGSYSSSTWF
ncbi:MAG: hypothetical protein MPK01_06325, partial [Gammaproteobacteria bacterium]|nr:hypothetical protein [Gammaproteobacteria bacterium]